MKLLIVGASQIVQVVDDGRRFVSKDGMKKVAVLNSPDGENGGLSVVVDDFGKISAVGTDSEISRRFEKCAFDRILDAGGKSVLPGLIDGHTHPVWAGDRVHEFSMKLAGATYMEVHQAGGGINFTVEHTKKATEEELTGLLRKRLRRMIRAGTTLVECKSGYGLETETELKMLRVLENCKKTEKIEISSTFCGAHSIPKGMTSEEAVSDVIEKQLVKVAEGNKTATLNVENIDVFCEKGVYNVEQTKKILLAGLKEGLHVNFHGDELNPLGGAEMGASLGPPSVISHLEEISDPGIEAMAKSGSVAVILPTTAYILRLKNPPVRKMIEAGVIVALGSDFNPNAFCLSMPAVMHLACVNQKMSLDEALMASTINAAHSLHRSDTHGSIEVGKVGDFIVLGTNKWEHLIYQFAGHDEVIDCVIKGGEIVYCKN